MSKLADTNLFKSIKVGDAKLEHRLVFPPSTRFRATKEGLPTDAMLKYYGDRAENNGGLVIVEATHASKKTGVYFHTPSFASYEIAQHWKPIVDQVHKNGSSIALQLWGLGRVADPQATKALGSQLLAPSKIYLNDDMKKAAESNGLELKEMTIDDIHAVQKDFVDAAKNAIELGFDFIELHAANGYLIEQFIRDTTNVRKDKYGGSIENRSRFLLELIDQLITTVGANKIAVRISPYSNFQEAGGINAPTHPIAQFGYILSELEKKAKKGDQLAYISFVEPVMLGDSELKLEGIESNPYWVEEIWSGVIMRSGNYTKEEDKLISNVNTNNRTLIGASRHFLSNPDLPYRLKNGLELTPYDRSRFYNAFSNNGYNTWNKYGVAESHEESEIAKQVPKAL